MLDVPQDPTTSAFGLVADAEGAAVRQRVTHGIRRFLKEHFKAARQGRLRPSCSGQAKQVVTL